MGEKINGELRKKNDESAFFCLIFVLEIDTQKIFHIDLIRIVNDVFIV